MDRRRELHMTTKDLKEFFKEHLVPKKLYKIGGEHKNRICIEQVSDGWDVFFKDKKQKIGLMHFGDEKSACDVMMNEIRKLMESVYGITWAKTV